MSQVDFSQIGTWIVSAWWPEQEALAAQLARGRALQQCSESLRVVGPYAFLTTGIGTPRAAMSVASALTSASSSGALPRALFFVATAGSYTDDLTINSAHIISGAVWSDGDLAAGRSYLPGVSRGEMLPATLPGASVSGEGRPWALSSPGITLESELAASLAGQAQLENLEVYGIALACQSLGVRWGASLGVSNSVGSMAHQQWKRHHQTASRAAQELLISQFAGEFSE